MNGDTGGRPFRPVLEALELLVEPGGVAELRAIGVDGRVSSGYFGDLERMAAAAEVLDASGEFSGIYLTLNPVDPALLSRRANRVQSRLGRKDATTSDGDILRRRWLPIDVDPVRPSGISATADEHRVLPGTLPIGEIAPVEPGRLGRCTVCGLESAAYRHPGSSTAICSSCYETLVQEQIDIR